jgi:mono/diheme cytochrome c family protein
VSARPASQRPSAAEVDPGLVELAWQRNCSKCHGARGRGDGPEGPMVKASDLTRSDWQAKVSDQEIADMIRKGKNKMPAFDLPPQVLEGLVRRIRSQRAPE